VPTLGGNPKRVLAGYAVAPSSDGKSLYFTKASTRTVYRADRTGMGEEAVLTMGPAAFGISRIMPFQDGQHLLISSASGISTTEGVQLFVADVENKSVELLTVIQGNPRDLTWLEQGKPCCQLDPRTFLTSDWTHKSLPCRIRITNKK
jgi:Tol biopolymer transport system component